MFPTILASIGCNIEGDRLGLGVNLFSSNQTLCDNYTDEELEEAILAKSDFYDKKLLKKSSKD